MYRKKSFRKINQENVEILGQYCTPDLTKGVRVQRLVCLTDTLGKSLIIIKVKYISNEGQGHIYTQGHVIHDRKTTLHLR